MTRQEKNVWLGQGLVFEAEIVAQQERQSDTDSTPFREYKRV